MGRKDSDQPYNYSRVGYARRHAIQTLDGYGCTTTEIIAMFGCSPATFHRYDQDVRLARRPARPARSHAMSADDAREIVMIALIRADYTVAEIAEAIGVSQATVYRERAAFEARLGDTSPAERRHIHRTLKRRIIDTRAYHEHRIDARRRSQRWRRGSRNKFSS